MYSPIPAWVGCVLILAAIVGCVASVIWGIEGVLWLIEHVEVKP